MVAGTQRRTMTVEEFERIAALPENADRRLEFIGGEVVEVVSNQQSSHVAARITGFLFMYLLEHKSGFLTSSDGGYMIGTERYIPDVAFVSQERQPEVSDQAYGPVAPDLAVEVLSPSDEPGDMRIKVVNYLRAGTTVWVVDPANRFVEVFAPDQAPQRIPADGTLSGGDILPGFTLAVADIFAE